MTVSRFIDVDWVVIWTLDQSECMSSCLEDWRILIGLVLVGILSCCWGYQDYIQRFSLLSDCGLIVNYTDWCIVSLLDTDKSQI